MGSYMLNVVNVGDESLLRGNWKYIMLDRAHFFAVLGFLQQSPTKLPVKRSRWHPSRRLAPKGPLLWSTPAQDAGSRPRPCLSPAPHGLLQTACAETRRDGQLTRPAPDGRGRWAQGAVPELGWSRASHCPGAEGTHSLDSRAVWR